MARKATRATRELTERPEDDIACVDLFCGAGGLTHGLISAGVKVRAGVDIDESCRHPYEANHEGIIFHQADITKLNASKVAEWFGDAKVRVLAGCAPCQPFSTYSLRYQKNDKVESDQRWGLLDHFGRLVRELLPDIVTMENVPTVMRHPVFKNFKSTLESLDYKVWVDVVDCAKYGLPQRRRRTVLLASLHGEIRLSEPAASQIRTVEDVIKDLPVLRHGRTDKSDRLHTASRLSDLNYERIRHAKPGGTWRDWPKHLVAKCHTNSTGKTYPAVYGRMRYDEPAPTLTTQFYGFGNGRFGHPTQARALSLREGALLQGFPKDYSFVPEGEPIRFKVLGRLIGNAVPVDLGRVVGQSIIEHVKHCFGRRPNDRHVDVLSPAINCKGGGMNGSTKVTPSSAAASKRMQGVRQKNTSAESALRRELYARGFRYRIHVPVLTKPRRIADVAFSGLRVAIFVDGCFWHGCPLHSTWPKQNAEFWRAKIEANMARDRDTDERLRAEGWEVIRVWAHEEPEIAADRIAHILERRRQWIRRP